MLLNHRGDASYSHTDSSLYALSAFERRGSRLAMASSKHGPWFALGRDGLRAAAARQVAHGERLEGPQTGGPAAGKHRRPEASQARGQLEVRR